jgi:hypothetical protein
MKKCSVQVEKKKSELTLKDITEVGTSMDLHFTSSSEDDSLSGKRTNLKSGYDVKNQAEVIHKVQWPHGYVSKLQHITDIKPDNLSVDTFFYGYMTILLQTRDESELKGRLQHARQLLWHSILHGWSSARAFHYQVLRELEMGNFSWTDQNEMALISLSAAHERSNTSSTSHTAAKSFNRSKQDNKADDNTSADRRSICCYGYNNSSSGCKFGKSGEGCKKLHACSSCATKGFFNKHSALNCKK